MKKTFQLSIMAILLTAGVTAMGQTRVLNAHYGGNVVFQTPVSALDSINADSKSYVNIFYSDARWSPHVNQIDSITFSMVTYGDTTLPIDPVSIDTTGMIRIVWNGASVSITNPYPDDSIKITAAGGHVTVKSQATTLNNVVYNLSGTSTDGNLLFNKLSTPVILRLDGVQLTSMGSAAINIDKNQNSLIHIVAETENSLADADSNADKAVVYTKGAFTLQGSGLLNVISSYANGLQGKRGVTVNNGNIDIQVTADTKKGIKSDQNFTMNGGKLNITASGSVAIDTSADYETGYDFSYCTGIKTGDIDKGTRGDIVINGGSLTVDCPATNAGGRCLSSDYDIIVNGGTTTLTTHGDGLAVGGTGRQAIDGYACACMSADSNIYIYGGRLDARSTGRGGRGIKADGNMTVGRIGDDDALVHVYVQTSGNPVNAIGGGGHGPWGGNESDYFKGLPKGIKIEGNLYFNSGHVGVFCAQSSGDPNGEAIESKDSLFINGGIIEANAYDDALNTANYLEINGGKIWCYSRGNDAVDCNGNTNVNGGFIIANGREVGFDAATDAGGHFALNGGTILCQGGRMGAWDRPNVSGHQPYLQINARDPWDVYPTALTIKNSAGEIVLMYMYDNFHTPKGNGFIENYTDPGIETTRPRPSNSYPIVFSSPEITNGTYQYWEASTLYGGTGWHCFFTGSEPELSGDPKTATAQ